MTLVEAFQLMMKAGYSQALDRHSRFPRPLLDWIEESKTDLSDWSADPQTGRISQNIARPCNEFRCTKNL